MSTQHRKLMRVLYENQAMSQPVSFRFQTFFADKGHTAILHSSLATADAMSSQEENPLTSENLVTLEEAAKDFGGISIPLNTIRYYAYQGVGGVKLETVRINRRYTSKEAIQRFIDKRQGDMPERSKQKVKMTPEEIDAKLRRFGVRK
jgi:hypothetical protein